MAEDLYLKYMHPFKGLLGPSQTSMMKLQGGNCFRKKIPLYIFDNVLSTYLETCFTNISIQELFVFFSFKFPEVAI